jgi:hypothetical protein
MNHRSAHVGIVAEAASRDIDADATDVTWVRARILAMSFAFADLDLGDEMTLAAGAPLFFVSFEEPAVALTCRAVSPASGTQVRVAFGRLDARDHEALRARVE